MKKLFCILLAVLGLAFVANKTFCQEQLVPINQYYLRGSMENAITIAFQNDEDQEIFLGANPNYPTAGISGVTSIKVGNQRVFQVAVDTFVQEFLEYDEETDEEIYTTVLWPRVYLAIGFSPDKLEPRILSFTPNKVGKKRIRIVASKDVTPQNFDAKKERIIVLSKTNEAVDNATSCRIRNASSYGFQFIDPGFPLYGLTLGPSDSLTLSESQKIKLINTGISVTRVKKLSGPGNAAEELFMTIAVYENAKVVVITDDYFAPTNRSDNKVYTHNVKFFSPFDCIIDGAYDRNGQPTIYTMRGGSNSNYGQEIFLKYGENPITIKYWDKKGKQHVQTVVLIGDRRGCLKMFYSEREKQVKVIL